jgi:TRAP-type C4-dicarboxylate transport system permease small subunit
LKDFALDYRDHYPAVLRWLSHMVDFFLALAGFAIVTLVFCNASLRGFAGFDLAWSLEVTSFLLLWSTFIGCAAAIARGTHMRVTEIVENLLPVHLQRVLSIGIDVIITCLLISLIYTGLQHLHPYMGAKNNRALLAGWLALRLHAGRHVTDVDLPPLQHGVRYPESGRAPLHPF